MQKHDRYPILEFKSPGSFEKWLTANGSQSDGVWLKIAKKASTVKTITYDEALDVALCFGWIDGLVRRLDDNFYIQKFTPRGKKSIWSKINRDNVARLIKSGKMQALGLAAIEAAKKDGRWDAAYDSPKTMEIPQEFLRELKKDQAAYDFFLKLNKTNRYAIGWRLQTAKTLETKNRRMRVIIVLLKNKQKLY